VLILALAFFTCGVFIVFCRKCDDQTKNTALCPTLLHLDASSHLGLIGTKSVASNSSQQSLVSDGSLLSGGFSKSDRGTNPRGSNRWEGGLGAGGGQVHGAVGGQGAGGDRQVVGAGGGRETIQSPKQGGGDATLTQSTKNSWSISRTTSGPSTTSVDPLRADLDSVLSAVIRRIQAEEERKKNGGIESGRWNPSWTPWQEWNRLRPWPSARTETTGAPSAPYFPGVSSSPDQRRRRRRLTEDDEEGEVKIRVKRRGVGGLGGQKGGYAFKGAEWKGPPIGCVLLLVAMIAESCAFLLISLLACIFLFTGGQTL